MDKKKVLWFDVETGGTEEKTDALLQVSAIIEIDNEVVDEIDLKMQPLPNKKVHPEAIATHGMQLSEIATFQKATEAHGKLETFLRKHNPSPTKLGRYIMAGYNADFDCRFLSQWYADVTGGPYDYWKHLQFSPIDILPTLRILRHTGVLSIPDTKLETVCKYFEIPIQAHDALSDIRATRELTSMVIKKICTEWTGVGWDLFGELSTQALKDK